MQFLGLSTDIPVAGNYDADGQVERAVWRPQFGGWYVDGQAPIFLGLSQDVPLPIPNAALREATD